MLTVAGGILIAAAVIFIGLPLLAFLVGALIEAFDGEIAPFLVASGILIVLVTMVVFGYR